MGEVRGKGEGRRREGHLSCELQRLYAPKSEKGECDLHVDHGFLGLVRAAVTAAPWCTCVHSATGCVMKGRPVAETKGVLDHPNDYLGLRTGRGAPHSPLRACP